MEQYVFQATSILTDPRPPARGVGRFYHKRHTPRSEEAARRSRSPCILYTARESGYWVREWRRTGTRCALRLYRRPAAGSRDPRSRAPLRDRASCRHRKTPPRYWTPGPINSGIEGYRGKDNPGCLPGFQARSGRWCSPEAEDGFPAGRADPDRTTNHWSGKHRRPACPLRDFTTTSCV